MAIDPIQQSNVVDKEKREIRIPLVDLVAQYESIRTELDEAMASVVKTGRYIGGDQVRTFAKSFASFCNASHCLPCANGTDALEIALQALGIGKGDEVILPAFTFVATMEAVINIGATPVLCDIDPQRYTLEAGTVRKHITAKTKAIIVVHLFGQMAAIDDLIILANEHNVFLIEDAAQAHGASYKGKRAGSIGVINTFSFYPGKNLGAYGDAGAITTNDEALYIKAKKIADHGRISKYDHEIIGRNSRLDALQAAVLNVKLNHLEAWNQRRMALAVRYHLLLSGVEGLELPTDFDDSEHVYHLFVICVKDGRRDSLREHLAQQGIETGIHYPIALTNLKVTTDQLKIVTSCEHAEQASTEVVSLPLYPELTEQMQDYICQHIIEFLKK